MASQNFALNVADVVWAKDETKRESAVGTYGIAQLGRDKVVLLIRPSRTRKKPKSGTITLRS
jgi:hypothetical protein